MAHPQPNPVFWPPPSTLEPPLQPDTIADSPSPQKHFKPSLPIFTFIGLLTTKINSC